METYESISRIEKFKRDNFKKAKYLENSYLDLFGYNNTGIFYLITSKVIRNINFIN